MQPLRGKYAVAFHCSWAYGTSLLLANAQQMRLRPPVPAAIHKGRRRQHARVQAVHAELLELLVVGHDIGFSLIVGEEHFAVDADRGGGKSFVYGHAAALLPEDLARLRFEAGDHADNVVDHVEILAVDERAGDERRALDRLPLEIGLGDVASRPARPNRQGGTDAAGTAEDHVVAHHGSGDHLVVIAGTGPDDFAVVGVVGVSEDFGVGGIDLVWRLRSASDSYIPLGLYTEWGFLSSSGTAKLELAGPKRTSTAY